MISMSQNHNNNLIPYINVKLALLGFQPVNASDRPEFADVISTLVAQYREKERLLEMCIRDSSGQTGGWQLFWILHCWLPDLIFGRRQRPHPQSTPI